MKIAFCLFKYFPFGGLQRDFLRIARVCRDRGHEIHVFTMSWEGEQEPGLSLRLLPPSGWQNTSRIQSYLTQLHSALADGQFDLVVGFNKMPGLDMYYAADVCFEARMRQRAFWHRWLPRYRFYHAMERAVFAPGQQTEILVISPFQQPDFIKWYQTESDRFHLLPPGIERNRLAPPNAQAIRQAMRDQLGVTPTDKLLLMVGSGFKTKGVDRAIRALASLPEALRKVTILYIVGQDDAAPFSRLAASQGVGDRVHFLGGRHDVPDLLLAADLLLHPAYHENTGTVLLEALAAGLPVVTVDHCGYAHYVLDARAGAVLSSPFDQAALNEVVRQLGESDLTMLRANALTFARQADIYSLPEQVADRIEAAAKRRQQVRFDAFMAMQGKVYREQKNRLTQRVTLAGKPYFLKRQTATGWPEIMKNLLQGRLPVTSLKQEWQAIERLQQLGVQVPAVIAKGERGANFASRESYVLLEDIAPSVSLEDFCRDWKQKPPDSRLKYQLISQVAEISRRMHEGGMNHRDFYLCHFLLKTDKPLVSLTASQLPLYLIDLHRAQCRDQVPLRWRIKDLAGLYFSSKDTGLGWRDYLRFIRRYQAKPLTSLTSADWALWQKVKQRGDQLYREHHE